MSRHTQTARFYIEMTDGDRQGPYDPEHVGKLVGTARYRGKFHRVVIERRQTEIQENFLTEEEWRAHYATIKDRIREQKLQDRIMKLRGELREAEEELSNLTL